MVAEEKIKEIREKREEIVAKAQQKAMEIFDQGKKKGDEKIRNSILLGEQERLNIIQAAKKETQREIDKMKDAERKREVESALALAEKILGEKLDSQKDKALIDKLLAVQK